MSDASKGPTAPYVRAPIARAGTTVLQGLVEMLAIGRFAPGDYLPPEQSLCDEFGVSRTVVRECIKRLQEKGMVTVTQGRGTQVTPFIAWNVLDPLVLSTLIQHDESLGVLDEVSVVRATLEAVMAGEVAARKDADSIAHIGELLEKMRELVGDDPHDFLETDVAFHIAVMEASHNRIAGNIARGMFIRARESLRYDGKSVPHATELTLQEHEAVFAAIEAGDPAAARLAMEAHILGSWQRRRLPNAVHD